MLAVDEGARRHAQHVGALGQDHLHVGAVTRQQLRVVALVDLGLHLDRTRLLLGIEHVGRDAAHVRGEMTVLERIERHARLHALPDARRVHLVDGRGHIDAARVHQVHRRWRRDADGGRGDELADLAVDLGDDAVEGCAQPRALELGTGRIDAGGRHAHRLVGRSTGCRGAIGLAGRPVRHLRGDELVLHQAREAFRLTAGGGRFDARLVALRLRCLGVTHREVEVGANVVVPEFQQQLALPDPVALLHRQFRDLARRRRRHAGPLARLDRAGPRVGDGLGDEAAAGRDGLDRDGLRPPRVDRDAGHRDRGQPESGQQPGADFHRVFVLGEPAAVTTLQHRPDRDAIRAHPGLDSSA